MADLFEDYRLGRAWDEMFATPGTVRPGYEQIHSALQTIAGPELTRRAEILGKSFLDQGVTFALGDIERPFPLDIVPRIVAGSEWKKIEAGAIQRLRALEMFLTDVYGAGQVFADRVVPRHVVATSSQFRREIVGMTAQDGARVVVSGLDLIRDKDGQFRVLEDNLRIPSGVSYVLQNRLALSQVLGEVTADTAVRSVAEYPSRLISALRAIAPPSVSDPTVVVLTPGIYNSAYYEHTLLAGEMGVELVEGRDLFCSNNHVYVRTTAGDMPVHVIYRRVDDEFLDPVHFRSDSLLGAPGLLNAARAGNVTIANFLGNGVADDKLIYTYVPDIIRYYLSEEPVLENVATYRMEDPEARQYALDNVASLVFKPVDGSGGKGIVIGSQADSTARAKVRAAVLENPRSWIAQVEIPLSTSPTLINGRLQPRHVDLRPFIVNDGSSIWVLPGGLTRVALPEGALVVNSSQGGGSKDTWVLVDDAPPVVEVISGESPTTAGQPSVGAPTSVAGSGAIVGAEPPLLAGSPSIVPTSFGPAVAPEPPTPFREQEEQQQQNLGLRRSPC